MKIRLVLLVIGLAAILCASAIAQKPAAKFSSVYMSLGAGCKVLRGRGGQDDAKICAGPGGYQVRVYSSATTTEIVAERKGSDDTFHVATVSLAFNESKSKLEWRLANGKPFAAILRVPKYADRPEGEAGVGKIIGEELVVVGLKGFSDLSTAVDAKSPAANSLAREAADSAYLAK